MTCGKPEPNPEFTLMLRAKTVWDRGKSGLLAVLLLLSVAPTASALVCSSPAVGACPAATPPDANYVERQLRVTVGSN